MYEMRNVKFTVCEELNVTFAKPPKDTTLIYRAPRSSSFPATTGTFLNGDLWRKTAQLNTVRTPHAPSAGHPTYNKSEIPAHPLLW